MILTFKFSRIIHFLGTMLIVMVWFGMNVSAQGRFDVERIQRATVFIMQTQTIGQNLVVTCVGSGTIVSRSGLILTNAHNTVVNSSCPGNTIIIGLNIRPGEPPIASYQAEVVQADPGLDLALLGITRHLDGQLVERESLALPFVELGDSNAVALDETITVVGYPGIADDPVVLERGTISGFASEPSGGDRSWLKTSATIRGTMSGGGAYNQDGELIGVPTTAPLSASSPSATCVNTQDSNGDGLINTSDICISIGGFINLLRPSNFARPLLRAAQLNLQVEMPLMGQLSAAVNASSGGQPRFRYLGFAPSVNAAGMPTTIIRSLPSGSDGLYLFFDYENMTPETVYELRVNTNGLPNPNFSLSPVRWSGGNRGLWYIGSSGQPYPNGIYDFTLFINGIAEGNARIVVGENSENAPQFGEIIFGLLDIQGNVTGTGYVLPTGTTANARFLYRNMSPGMAWAAIWYYQGREVQRTPADTVWLDTDGASGNKTISIQDPNGLPPGSYRLELYIEGRLTAVSDFTIAGGQDGNFARIFTDTHFTTASNAQEAQTAAPISTFSSAITTIYALFDWQLIASGTLWRVDWSVDGNVFYSQTHPWSGAQTGENFVMSLSSPGGLPDGTYQIDLYIGALPFDSARARVGIGQLPIDQFADPEGIVMRGQVVDAVSRQGIAGVSVLLVSQDFSASEFTQSWLQSQLFASATTDRNGNFQINRPLARNVPYSIVFIAEGYLPVTADGVEITDEEYPDNTPIDFVVELTPE